MGIELNIRNRVAAILSLCSICMCAVSVAESPSEEKADAVVIGKKFLLESKILGERRPYWVHTPSRYENRKDAYPVPILLDGDSNFAHTTAAVDCLPDNERIPRMLVVGGP